MSHKGNLWERAAVVFVVGTLTVVGFRLVHWLLSLFPTVP